MIDYNSRTLYVVTSSCVFPAVTGWEALQRNMLVSSHTSLIHFLFFFTNLAFFFFICSYDTCITLLLARLPPSHSPLLWLHCHPPFTFMNCAVLPVELTRFISCSLHKSLSAGYYWAPWFIFLDEPLLTIIRRHRVVAGARSDHLLWT